VAGCDPDPAARAGFAARHGVPACETVEALLANADFDAAYIASPHGSAAHTLAMAGAGKHVLVEKPMAVTLAEAASMIRAAETAGTVLMVGPSHGYDPRGGGGGAGSVRRGGGVRLIHAFNYTDFLYRPRRPAELDTARGGGVILSQATHQIDMVRRIAGSPVTSVRAWTGGWDARATEGAFTALLFFANGAVANLTYSGYARYDSDALAGWVGEMGGAKSPAAHGQARARLAAIDERQAKAAARSRRARYRQARRNITSGSARC
jgi:phthalate 4,5-cis-dihydrodiol dehydrogenase